MADRASVTLLQHEPWIRLGASVFLFTLLAAAEALLPRRRREVSRARRWPANLGVMLLDGLVVRVVAPAGAVGFALYAETRGWGWLPQMTWPGWVEALLAFVLLDLAIYGQHWLVHRVPMLWRFHRMHHADRDMDVTTGARFHPVEIVFSLGLKFLVVAGLGAPPAAVLWFEVALNGTSLFNHANLRLPPWLDAALRFVVVTPDMHRVHSRWNRHFLHCDRIHLANWCIAHLYWRALPSRRYWRIYGRSAIVDINATLGVKSCLK